MKIASKKGRASAAATGAALAGLLLAGCGGSTDSAESSSAPAEAVSSADSSAPASEAPAELTKVSIVMPWVIQGEVAGQIAAVKEGFFADEGLDVEIVPGGPDVRAGALLASGSADYAILNPSNVYTNREQGIPLVGIAGINQSDGTFLVCKSSTGIAGWKDLAGKKVGIWVGGEAGIQAAAAKAGVPVDSVEWLPQKFSMDEFFNDAFDCASATEWNEKHIVYNKGYTPGKNLVELRPSDVGLFLPGDSVTAMESTVADHPEAAQGVVDGVMRGWQWTCSSPDNRKKAAQYVVDEAPDLDLDLQAIQIDEMCNLMAIGPAKDAGKIGVMAAESWQQTADAALAAKQLESPADVNSSMTSQFVDAVPAEDNTITW